MISAPPEIAYCARCGRDMVTRRVADRPRRVCPDCGYIHFTEPKVGVGVLVQDAGGRLLLVQRGAPPERGKWALPAGYLDHGEEPAVTATREVLEETGLAVRVTGLIDVYHNPPEQGGASIFILYRAEVIGGELAAADDASDAGFFVLDDLPELAFESTRDAVRRLFEGGR